MYVSSGSKFLALDYSKFDPGLIQVWSRLGPGLVQVFQVWSRFAPGLVQVWLRFGSNFSLFGLNLAQVWPDIRIYLSCFCFLTSDLGESSSLHDDDGDDLFKALFFPSDLQAHDWTGLCNTTVVKLSWAGTVTQLTEVCSPAQGETQLS